MEYRRKRKDKRKYPKRLTFSLTEEQRELVERDADRFHLSMSELMRRLIDRKF